MSDAAMVPLTEGATNGADNTVRETGKGGQVSINTDAFLQAKAEEEAAKANGGKTEKTENNGKGDDGKAEVKPMPKGGHEKFYNAKTGEYNYEAHLREDNFRAEQAAKKAAKNGTQTKDEDGDDEAAKKLADEAGLDWQGLGEKIEVLGDIDQDDYAALEKIGVPKDIVQDYITVHKIASEAVKKEALEYIGGEKGRDELIGWVAKNLPDEEINRYNAMLASPSWKDAIDIMRAKMMASGRRSYEPANRINGNTAGASDDVYSSFAEQQKDQADPRYRTDPTFRQRVIEKIARSGNYSIRTRI